MDIKDHLIMILKKRLSVFLIASAFLGLTLEGNPPVAEEMFAINGINISTGEPYTDIIQPISNSSGNVDACQIVRYDDDHIPVQKSHLSIDGAYYSNSFKKNDIVLSKILHKKSSCKRPQQGPPGPVLGNYLFFYSGFPFQNITVASTWTPIFFSIAAVTDGQWVVTPPPVPSTISGMNFSNPNSGVYLITLSVEANIPANATFLMGCFNITQNLFVASSNGGMTTTTNSGLYLLTETFLINYQANDVLQFQIICDQLPSGITKPFFPSTSQTYCASLMIVRIQ